MRNLQKFMKFNFVEYLMNYETETIAKCGRILIQVLEFMNLFRIICYPN